MAGVRDDIRLRHGAANGTLVVEGFAGAPGDRALAERNFLGGSSNTQTGEYREPECFPG